MKREKELTKNTFILFIGVFFTKVFQYFLLPLYTSYLTSSEYGVFELYNSFIYLLVPFVGLQIDQGIFRFLIKNRDSIKDSKKTISTVLLFLLGILIIYSLLYLVISPLINIQYKNYVFILLVMNIISSVFLQIARGLGNNRDYSLTGVIIAIFTIIANIILLVLFGYKENGLIIGGTIGYIVGTFILIFRLGIHNYFSFNSFDLKLLKKILKYSIPMIPNSISWWLISSSDRYIMAFTLGTSATGLLSVAYKFSNIIIILYNVLFLSLSESLSLHIDDSDISDYYNGVFNNISKILTFVLIIITSFLPFLFKILINNSYSEAFNLIPIAILASSFQVYAGLLSSVYIAKSDTKSIALSSLSAAFINVVLDVALVRYMGLYSAVISTLISFIILFLYRFIDINKKHFHLKISSKLLYNFVVLFIIGVVLYIKILIVKYLIIAVLLLFVFFINKENILYLYKYICKRIGSHEKK